VRGAAHLRCWRDHIDVAYFLQGFLEFDEPIGMDAVIVCK